MYLHLICYCCCVRVSFSLRCHPQKVELNMTRRKARAVKMKKKKMTNMKMCLTPTLRKESIQTTIHTGNGTGSAEWILLQRVTHLHLNSFTLPGVKPCMCFMSIDFVFSCAASKFAPHSVLKHLYACRFFLRRLRTHLEY